jgi:hypothetical protein
MNGRTIVIGFVKNNQFHPLSPKPTLGEEMRLTHISRQESRPPDAGLLDLSEHEGVVIAVQGYLDSSWLYEAAVVDKGGLILTAIAQEVFGQRGQ